MIFKQIMGELRHLLSQITRWEPAGRSELNKDALVERLEKLEGHILHLEEDHLSRKALEQQLETALCHIADAVIVTTTDNNIRLINPSFEKLLDQEGREILEKDLDLFLDSDSLLDMKNMHESLKRRKDWRGKLLFEKGATDTFLAEVTATPVILPDGSVTHHILTLRDITSREEMENRIKGQNQFLETILKTTPGSFLVLRENGTILLDNTAAKTLVSDMGKGASQTLANTLLKTIDKKASTGSSSLELEMEKTTPRHFAMQWERVPESLLHPEVNSGYLYLISLADITELKKKDKEIEIRMKTRKASRIEKRLVAEELTNSLVYKLLQPCNMGKAITSRMYQLINDKEWEKLEGNLQLVRELLTEMESDMLKIRKEEVDSLTPEGSCYAVELADGMEVFYRQFCEEHGINFQVASAPASMMFPLPFEIMQLVSLSIMDNALESKEKLEALKVNVSFEELEKYNQIHFEDNGKGIPKEMRLKIFEPFFTTKPNRQGVSLTIVHQLVEKASGNIQVHKGNDNGTRITISLPKRSSL